MSPGFRHSDETRARIAAARSSPSHRAAHRAALQGKPLTPDHCDAISQTLLDYYAVTRPCGPMERAGEKHGASINAIYASSAAEAAATRRRRSNEGRN
jgi:hypothetical protein